MSRSEALKAMCLTSQVRTDLALCRKSKLVSGRIIKQAEDEFAHYLAQTKIIYPPSLRLVGLKPDQPYNERKQVLKIPDNCIPETEEQVEFNNMLATAGRKMARSNWIWRIGQECSWKSEQGWYGFFVTLTVDPSKVPNSAAMWQEGREFRKYIRRLAKVSAKACGQPRAIHEGASCSDYVQHVGVIEHGKSNHHHHMHLLIWMRDIPDNWKRCPNRGIKNPEHKIHDWCRPMSTYWPNSLPGLGRAKFFRHEGDVWSRLGFALPFDKKKKRVIRINTAETAGLYIAKYMDKEDKAWTHRIKATRNLGMGRLKLMIQRLHKRKVEALTWRPITYQLNTLATTIHSVPPGLLRLIAKQELFYRNWAANTLDLRALMNAPCDSYSAMQKSVLNGANPKRMRSNQFYEWVSEHLPEPKGYCEKRYLRACHSLGSEFKPLASRPTEHLGIT